MRYHAQRVAPDEMVEYPAAIIMAEIDSDYQSYGENLAAAFFHSDWTPKSLHPLGSAAIGPRRRWLKALIERILSKYPQPPRNRSLIEFIANDQPFRDAWIKHEKRHGSPLEIAKQFELPARMQPPLAPIIRAVPALETPGKLADWLGIPVARLAWYADLKDLNGGAAENLGHYRYRWLPKRGTASYRLLEEPKPILKSIQRQILSDILGCLAPHDAAHGFRMRRSILTNAAGHCGKAVVVQFDLKDFFPSVRPAKVTAIFDSLGYPRKIARLLTGLCTSRVPDRVWKTYPVGEAPIDRHHPTRISLAARHLPQGAPTSPALANLCALRLDYRLSALALKLGLHYTRYADDLTFSGYDNFAPRRLQRCVMKICFEEGFTFNPRKTRIQRQSSRQIVAGVVVNVRPNVKREDYDRLKAILHNCVRTGLDSQNRTGHAAFRAHLSGRIAQVAMINPDRGRKLWLIFDRIPR